MEKTLVTWHAHAVTRQQRERINGHCGCVVWFTGLSGSGKSTIANAVDCKLAEAGVHSYLLDGDNVRHGLNASPEMLRDQGEAYAKRFGLGFSAEDRQENIRRIGAVAQLFAAAGIVTLTAFVSPYRRDRHAVRRWSRRAGGRGILWRFSSTRRWKSANSVIRKGCIEKAADGGNPRIHGIQDPYGSPEVRRLRCAGQRNRQTNWRIP